MWFTIAVEEDSKLGLQGTLDVLQELTGAESIRQLPTLKLFKIRMDLEMEGDTDALARPASRQRAGRARARSPTTTSTARSSARRRATCRSSPSPTPTPPRELGITSRALLEHLARHAGARAAAPRRRDPLPPPRRLLAPTAWASGRCPRSAIAEVGPRMAAFRGISHCYQRPTYADWPYSVFTMAHGRSKEECDAILDAIAGEIDCIEDRATLYSLDRVQEGPPAVLHRRLQDAGSASTPASDAVTRLADATPASAELYARAVARAARRRELAGPRDARDRPRPAVRRPRRGRRAGRRRRQPLRRLGLLVGPADPRPRPPGRRSPRSPTRPRRGTTFGAPTAGRGRARRGGRRRDARRSRCCA